jgi:hypothetical protein
VVAEVKLREPRMKQHSSFEIMNEEFEEKLKEFAWMLL